MFRQFDQFNAWFNQQIVQWLFGRAFAQSKWLAGILGVSTLLLLAFFSALSWPIMLFIAAAVVLLVRKQRHETIMPTPLPDRQAVSDIWQHLRIDEQHLYVDECAVERLKLKKIVSDQIDDDYALIDFPYNPHLTGYCYPRQQLADVTSWLKRHLPHIELIQ